LEVRKLQQDLTNIFRVSISNENAIETITYKSTVLSLLSSGDGTEVIHHKLPAGHRWALNPEDGWNALEFFYIISGKLIWKHENGERKLVTGSSVSAQPVKEPAIFFAEEDTEFIYVSSQPVFHHYSKAVRDTMNLAVSVEKKDGYTSDHCQRIMKFSMLVGEKLNLPSHELVVLNLAAFLHDVGKVNISDSILRKPSKLTDEEWLEMKKHPLYGYDLLMKTKFPLLEEAAKIVVQHHERYDGKGYPYGLDGEKIHLAAAIISVVDSYDAMTTDRVYRDRLSKEEALQEIIANKGKMYHPIVVDTFLSLSDKIN
jgi:HD-GYP domain-containing protein (c-di-GMP phosphodiesterase class II)